MKKKKLSFSEMCKMLSYYDFYDTSITKFDGRKIYGTMYKIDRMLSDIEKAELLRYDNVSLFVSQCQFAPEIKRSCVFLANKCWRNQNG